MEIFVALTVMGLVSGLGLLFIGMRPQPLSPHMVLATLNAYLPGAVRAPTPVWQRTGMSRKAKLGLLTEQGFTRVGVRFTMLSSSLAVAERSLADHLSRKVLAVAYTVLSGAAFAALLAVAGIGVPGVALFWFVVVVSAIAWFFPDLALMSLAYERRKEMRHALSSYLHLVSLLLAGGAGISSAAHDAVLQGNGWAFTVLRERLGRSVTDAEATLADVFTGLGEEMDMLELRQLGSAITLAGSEGVRVRETLITKANSLRVKEASEREEEAVARATKLTVPNMLVMAGFMLFLLFAAMMLLLTSLSGASGFAG